MLRSAGASLGRWLALALPLAAVLNYAYGSLPLTKLDRRMALLERGAERVQILGLGSSRMEAALEPGHLAVAALNMGGGAQDLYYDSQIVLLHLARARNLRVVVWGIDQWAFGYDMGRLSKAETVLPLYDEYFPRRHPRRLGLRTALQQQLPLIRTRGSDPIGTLSTLLSNWAGGDPRSDWSALDGLVDNDDGAQIATYHRTEFFRPEIQGEGLSIVLDTIGRLKRRGIHVTIVTMPVMPSYLRALAPDMAGSFRLGLEQVIRETAVDHLDLSRAFRPGTGHFADSGHLSPKGAKAFTEMVAAHVAPHLRVSSSVLLEGKAGEPAAR